MDISAFLKKAASEPKLRLPQLRLPQLKREATGLQPTSAQASTSVRISVAARKLSSSGETTTEGTDPASAMRELLAKYDFHSITPRQMAEVGGALYERHEISTDAASSFIGVETNLVEPMDADKPIDMVQHFQHMLDVAADANKREPGYFDFAVKFRQEASRALTDVMTFVADDRSHVSTAR